jgi:DNA topoisomerase I
MAEYSQALESGAGDDATSETREAAEGAGLIYVSDEEPGIRRRSVAGEFVYLNSRGQPVRNADTLRRIRSLAVPPAYTDVWICSKSNGHIQATGRDARGRKQYRYHPRWIEARDQTKYDHVLRFAASLPELRRRVREDLAKRGLPREKVLATIVSLAVV